jgi:hypothetical protein
MMEYLQAVVRHVRDQRGAEIAEWVLWVGGVALLAGVIYTVLSGQLNSTASNILSNLSISSGS